MGVVCVAGACSRAGKTALAETVLRALPPLSALAVKFTTTDDVFERCPRGTPCVVCDIDVPYRIVEDPAVLAKAGTDTDRLARAGASRVIWAIARRGAAAAAWEAVAKRMGGARLAVLEGSSVAAHARPDLLLFVAHPFLAPARWKPGSAGLVARADAVVVNLAAGEARSPSLEVLDELRRHHPRAEPRVADLTQPLAGWARDLDERLRAVSGTIGGPDADLDRPQPR